MDIFDSINAYEAWLRRELPGEIVEAGLDAKHAKMRKPDAAFEFLRATYWRWAEIVDEHIAELIKGKTKVLGVGDVHLENFGTWRDADGRLVWGVNDFDEAARMPFTLDLVRLATSLRLGMGAGADRRIDMLCATLCTAYAKGIEAPRPIIVEHCAEALRERLQAGRKDPAKFWKDLDAPEADDGSQPAKKYIKALRAALPRTFRAQAARDGDGRESIETCKIMPHQSGLGSLGRPRWLLKADWRGGPLAREAKALVPSAWNRHHAPANGELWVEAAATGRWRSPDPWFRVTGNIAVRRLSPHNRKIEAKDLMIAEIDGALVELMGRELANIHVGERARVDKIKADLEGLPKGWLAEASRTMAKVIAAEQKVYAARV